MKHFLFSCLFVFCIQSVFSQKLIIPEGKDTLQFLLEILANNDKTLNSVRLTQDTLRKENVKLKHRTWSRDSFDYIKAYETATMAATVSKSISEKISLIHTGIETDKGFLAIAKSQNITNSNFPEIMANAAASMLENPKDTAKANIWKNVVRKLAKNPLLESVLKSNPVSSVVLSVVNIASSWFNQKITGTNFSNAKIEVKAAISSEKIKGFTSQMKLYIEYFDELNNLTVEFESSINRLQSKYVTLVDSASVYDSQFEAVLNSKKFNYNKISAINSLFEFKGDLKFNPDGDLEGLRKILDKDKVNEVLAIASKYSYFDRKINEYESEYRSEIISFFARYYQIINVKSKRRGTQVTLDILDENALATINTSLLNTMSVNRMRLEQIQKRIERDKSN